MQAPSVKVAWKVMLVQGIYLAVIGLLWIFLTQTIVAPTFASFTAQSWSDFLASNPKPAELLTIVTKVAGAWVFVIAFLTILIAWKSYSKAEKWSWYAFLVTGIIGWGSSLTYHTIIGWDLMTLVMCIVGVILFVIGIVLPAKAILGRSSGHPSKDNLEV